MDEIQTSDRQEVVSILMTHRELNAVERYLEPVSVLRDEIKLTAGVLWRLVSEGKVIFEKRTKDAARH